MAAVKARVLRGFAAGQPFFTRRAKAVTPRRWLRGAWQAGKAQADAGKSQSGAILNIAKARTEGMPDGGPEPKTPLDYAEQIANIRETNATSEHKIASAQSLRNKDRVTPLQLLADYASRDADLFVTSIQKIADRSVEDFHRGMDRRADDYHRDADRAAQERIARLAAARRPAQQ